MDSLITKVEKWAYDRGLINPDFVLQQLAKTLEELGETASCIIKKKENGIKDGIGDTVVCLIILAKQNGLNLKECLFEAYEQIKERTGETRNGNFVKSEDIAKEWREPVKISPPRSLGRGAICGDCEQSVGNCTCHL